MPLTSILLMIYAVSLVIAIIGFSKKLPLLKWLAVLLFIIALILTVILVYTVSYSQ